MLASGSHRFAGATASQREDPGQLLYLGLGNCSTTFAAPCSSPHPFRNCPLLLCKWPHRPLGVGHFLGCGAMNGGNSSLKPTPAVRHPCRCHCLSKYEMKNWNVIANLLANMSAIVARNIRTCGFPQTTALTRTPSTDVAPTHPITARSLGHTI